MPVRKLREMKGSCGVSLPIDDLRRDGLVDEDGNPTEAYLAIDRVGDGEYEITRVDPDEF